MQGFTGIIKLDSGVVPTYKSTFSKDSVTRIMCGKNTVVHKQRSCRQRASGQFSRRAIEHRQCNIEKFMTPWRIFSTAGAWTRIFVHTHSDSYSSAYCNNVLTSLISPETLRELDASFKMREKTREKVRGAPLHHLDFIPADNFIH